MPNDLNKGPFEDAKDAPTGPLERLTSAFTPAPLPPIGPDGAPVFTPAPTAPPPMQPMWRCELGPCRHLHTFTSKIESQEPTDGSSGPIHTIGSATCYPAPGCEVDLSGHPVFECSHWSPMTESELYVINTRRSEWSAAHKAELEKFNESWANRSQPPGDNK